MSEKPRDNRVLILIVCCAVLVAVAAILSMYVIIFGAMHAQLLTNTATLISQHMDLMACDELEWLRDELMADTEETMISQALLNRANLELHQRC